MKFVKFGILALSMGLFVASCGDSTENEETLEDTTTITTDVIAPAPMDTSYAMPADTTMVTDTATIVH